MTDEPRPEEQTDEDLVAYLDGETDPDSSRQMEAKLSIDPKARAEADAMRRTWDMLDYLPRPEPSASFTHRTLDRISALRPSVSATVPQRGRSYLAGLRWAAAVLVAWLLGLAGVLAYSHFFGSSDRTDQAIIHDLRVVDGWRGYHLLEDITLLRALDHPDLFGEDTFEAVAAPAAPVDSPAAVAEPTPEELEANRKVLDRWRHDREHYERLKHDLQEFAALPAESQDRLRRLDRELREEDSASQLRLLHVLERYNYWLEHLPEESRTRVKEAAGTADRFRVIRALREQEWVERLPVMVKSELLSIQDPAARAAKTADLRQEEQKFRLQWARIDRPEELPRPKGAQLLRLQDFPPQVQSYVQNSLKPLLSNREKEQLKDAEGQGVVYARKLLELADHYAPFIPGTTNVTVPMKWEDLPRQLQNRFADEASKTRLAQVNGVWPDFGVVLLELTKKKNKNLPAFAWAPSQMDDLQPLTKEFIGKHLLPLLSQEEKASLDKAAGTWPKFTQTASDLAHKKGLNIAGMDLPGARSFWKQICVSLPEVLPQKLLIQFDNKVLTQEERTQWNSPDPASTKEQRLKELYYKRYPERLKNQLTKDYDIHVNKMLGEAARKKRT